MDRGYFNMMSDFWGNAEERAHEKRTKTPLCLALSRYDDL